MGTDAQDKKVNKYSLRLPPDISGEYFTDFFNKNLWVIRAVHIIIVLIIMYPVYYDLLIMQYTISYAALHAIHNSGW